MLIFCMHTHKHNHTHTKVCTLPVTSLAYLLYKKFYATFVISTDQKQGNKEKICFDSKKKQLLKMTSFAPPPPFFFSLYSTEVRLGTSETCMQYTFSQNPGNFVRFTKSFVIPPHFQYFL